MQIEQCLEGKERYVDDVERCYGKAKNPAVIYRKRV
jgi:hypothetical protein